MRLSDYLSMTNKSAATFAAEIGHSTAAVNYWKTGERTPRIAQMQKIFEATNGAVTPNDFMPTVSCSQEHQPQSSKDIESAA